MKRILICTIAKLISNYNKVIKMQWNSRIFICVSVCTCIFSRSTTRGELSIIFSSLSPDVGDSFKTFYFVCMFVCLYVFSILATPFNKELSDFVTWFLMPLSENMSIFFQLLKHWFLYFLNIGRATIEKPKKVIS